MKNQIFILLLMLLHPVFFLGNNKPKNDYNKLKDTIREKHPKIFIDSTRHIIYDFKTGKYLKDIRRIKVHTPVVFRVKNINPFVYKIIITPKDSIVGESWFDKEFMTMLTGKELQKAENKLLEEQADSGKNMATQTQIVTKKEYIGNPAEQENNKKGVKAIQKNILLKNENKKLQAKVEETIDGLGKLGVPITNRNPEKVQLNIESLSKTDTISFPKTLNSLSANLKDLLEKISINSNEIKQNESFINDKTKEYEILLDDFNNKYNSFIKDSRAIFSLLRVSKKVDVISNIPDLDSFKYIKYSQEIMKYSDSLLKGTGEVDEYKKSFSELGNAYYKLISMNHLKEIMEKSGVEKLLSYPAYLKEKSDALNDWFVKFNIDKVIAQAFWVTTQLNNPETFITKSDPVQPENDMIQFHIKIEPRDKTRPESYHNPRDFTYKQALYGGTRVDFSLGLAAAHYWDAPIYEVDRDNKIKSSFKNMFSPSLVGMVTMSWRKSGYLSYGGSFGMGLDITDGKIQFSNFFIGPTILLGKKQRIFITAGPSVKNVGRLKDGFDGFQINGTNDLSSYTSNYYKIGVFASVTYSLTKDARLLIKNLR
ncbi:hypothetical protein [uncultured Chryseobacterium sp.]|uniref:hypothetical protein n=1 Tax=uncultured Chryseobacterium sp. TaxID=259322 RepID=UPI0025FECFCB|nr:hypothetical protein [uncultured Chryseobacterium sp.]